MAVMLSLEAMPVSPGQLRLPLPAPLLMYQVAAGSRQLLHHTPPALHPAVCSCCSGEQHVSLLHAVWLPACLQDEEQLVAAFEAGIAASGKRLRLAVLDLILSFPPVIMPVQRLCKLFRCVVVGATTVSWTSSQPGTAVDQMDVDGRQLGVVCRGRTGQAEGVQAAQRAPHLLETLSFMTWGSCRLHNPV